jgi:putative tricarboxylic transport membrane protein
MSDSEIEIVVDDPTAPEADFLGLYVASFFLIAAFMRMVGRIALWKSLLTALVFTAAMFVTFDIAFDVIMPKGPLEAAFGY